MTTDYEGIDYGCGKTNIDTNGIRYGVIHQNEVLQAWADSSEAVYEHHCPYCGEELDIESPEEMDCPACKKSLKESDWDFNEPSYYKYEEDGYIATTDDVNDIMIVKSPYYTYAQFCSPCAPGAGYLMKPLEEKIENNRTYCFGHDWFEGDKAPYIVYSVETNEEIKC